MAHQEQQPPQQWGARGPSADGAAARSDGGRGGGEWGIFGAFEGVGRAVGTAWEGGVSSISGAVRAIVPHQQHQQHGGGGGGGAAAGGVVGELEAAGLQAEPAQSRQSEGSRHSGSGARWGHVRGEEEEEEYEDVEDDEDDAGRAHGGAVDETYESGDWAGHKSPGFSASFVIDSQSPHASRSPSISTHGGIMHNRSGHDHRAMDAFAKMLLEESEEDRRARPTVKVNVEEVWQRKLENEQNHRRMAQREVPHCIDDKGDPRVELDAEAFREEWIALVNKREAERARKEAPRRERAARVAEMREEQREAGNIIERQARNALGEVRDEFKAHLKMQQKFNSKLRVVHREAAMVLHATMHRPSAQDYASYLHDRDPHFIRNNAEAAAHAGRFVYNEKELNRLETKAIIEIVDERPGGV